MALQTASQWRKWFFGGYRVKAIYMCRSGLEVIIQKNDLRGYYNDVTNKYSSKYGPQALEKNGIPVNQLSNGHGVYCLTSIAQCGLGTYDIWLWTGEEEPYNGFIRCSRWLIGNQDELRGCRVLYYLEDTPENPHSSMTEGEGAPLLYRAGVVNEDKSLKLAADKAIGLMILPIEDGGTVRIVDGGIDLDGTPNKAGSAILWLGFLSIRFIGCTAGLQIFSAERGVGKNN